jgi:hypothetical protein
VTILDEVEAVDSTEFLTLCCNIFAWPRRLALVRVCPNSLASTCRLHLHLPGVGIERMVSKCNFVQPNSPVLRSAGSGSRRKAIIIAGICKQISMKYFSWSSTVRVEDLMCRWTLGRYVSFNFHGHLVLRSNNRYTTGHYKSA